MLPRGLPFIVQPVLCLLTVTALAQNAGQTPPRSQLDATNWGVVYDVPATKQVKIRQNVPYLSNLAIDIYTPPDMKADETRPAVVFLNAIGDSAQSKVKS
ncbi:MAG: hypothetical protein U0X75_21855 [Acidobacteriota bacterium]